MNCLTIDKISISFEERRNMNAKTTKNIHQVKAKMLDGWYFCMKPLAKLIEHCEDKKYRRKRRELSNMPLEEVARLYVKYTVKYMAKRKNPKEKYYCCTKKEGYSDYYEDCFVLADLSRFEYSRFTKTMLGSWSYYNPEYKAIGYGEESKKRWIDLENKIRPLVEKEFIRVGCKVEHVDESDKLDEWFIKQSGYENTMVVTI